MRRELWWWVPAGVDLRQEAKWIGGGLGISFLYSLTFFASYANENRALYWVRGSEKVLRDGAVMADFKAVLGNSLVGFWVVALCMAALLVYHIVYHYQGSKSIYLMRRLPSRRELWRRCVALPLLAALLSLCLAMTALVLYYMFYMASTPEACLTPGQWQKLWGLG